MKIPALLASLSLCAVSARADITIKSKSSSGGFRGMGGFEAKSTRSISELKSREEQNTKYTGAIMGMMSGKDGKDGVRIVRIDLDKQWQLDPKKKIYRESPIKLPKGETKNEDAGSGEPSKGKEEKPTHRIKSAKAGVEHTGKTKKINGFDTTQHIGTLTVVVEEIETKETAEFSLRSEIWATPWTKDLKKAVEEERKFMKAYVKKMGFEMSPEDAGKYGLAMSRMFLHAAGPEIEKAVSKLAKEMGEIEGYPIVTDSAWNTPSAPEKTAKKSKKKKDEDEDDGDAISDAAGATSLGGLAGNVFGGMAKRAAKKKAKESMGGKPGAAAYSVRTEVVEVKTADVPADSFEIPAGYKKKD
jgi:hypothetical protein